MDVIRLADVGKVFKIQQNTVTALNSVHLQIPLGSKVSITGKSGSGKSTLLHILGTLDQPSSGSVFFGDAQVHKFGDRQLSQLRCHKIGFIFQMNNLLPEFTALENVLMPALIAGVSHKIAANKAMQLLSEVGLSDRCSHRPGEMSGGEQQRVAIARALMMDPILLLADEPTGNLDHKTSLEIQELLLSLADKLSMTMVVVTHDIELAGKFSSRVEMQDGRIVSVSGDVSV